MTAPDGSAWEIDGEVYETNPSLTLPPAYFEVIRLWRLCQGGMGGYTGAWPDPGGIYDQASIMLDAFSVLSQADAAIRTTKKR